MLVQEQEQSDHYSLQAAGEISLQGTPDHRSSPKYRATSWERETDLNIKLTHFLTACAEKFTKEQNRQTSDIQRFNLIHHAQGVMLIAATPLHRILTFFHPTRLIIDEGSQMKEYTTVAVLAKHVD